MNNVVDLDKYVDTLLREKHEEERSMMMAEGEEEWECEWCKKFTMVSYYHCHESGGDVLICDECRRKDQKELEDEFYEDD
jgi:hypothetical protein